MKSEDAATQAARALAASDPRVRLAYQRTFLAQENNQMAWVRTTLALISFGFTIAKVFEVARGGHGAQVHASRIIGDVMIVVGLAILILTDVQHRRALATLRAQCTGLPKSSATLTGILLGVLGVAALVGVNV